MGRVDRDFLFPSYFSKRLCVPTLFKLRVSEKESFDEFLGDKFCSSTWFFLFLYVALFSPRVLLPVPSGFLGLTMGTPSGSCVGRGGSCPPVAHGPLGLDSG